MCGRSVELKKKKNDMKRGRKIKYYLKIIQLVSIRPATACLASFSQKCCVFVSKCSYMYIYIHTYVVPWTSVSYYH